MLVIIGKSASGKTTIEKCLKETEGYSNIVSYTTRPVRNGEVDGINYHYVTEDEFIEKLNNSFLAEHVNNYGNYYGVAKEDCKNSSLVIVEKNGLKQLNDVDDLDICSIYLYVSPITRLKRMWYRKDKLKDIVKRILTDDVKFFGAKRQCTFSVKSKSTKETAIEIDYLYRKYLNGERYD